MDPQIRHKTSQNPGRTGITIDFLSFQVGLIVRGLETSSKP
jgi:hypothetical protein